MSQLPVENGSSQLSEDDLFRLLINRIRQREENEIAAANLQEQMEAEVLDLKEENKTLKDQLDVSVVQLQKRTSEIKTYKTQMERWKIKLGKFKQFLNEFGNDYQTLRDEASHLKATEASLHNEKKVILSTISDVREQVSQVTQSVGDRRGLLMESENTINSLKQALKNTEEKACLAHKQLLEEKRRIAVLESYIQNYSRNQAKQLVSIRGDQREVLSRLDSVFETIGKKWESSHTVIQGMIGPMLDECVSSLKDLGEKYSVGKLDMQQVTETILSLIPR